MSTQIHFGWFRLDTTNVVIYGVLTVLFGALTLVVLRKDRNLVNLSFASGTFLLTFYSLLVGLYYINNDWLMLKFMGSTLGVIAPIGIFYSSLIIFDGRAVLRNYGWLVTFMVYSIIQVILVYQATFANDLVSRAAMNIFLNFPLALGLFGFVRVSRLIPEEQHKILLVSLGIGTAIIGLLAYSVLLLMESSIATLGLLLEVIGVSFMTLAFTNVFASGQSDQDYYPSSDSGVPS